MCDDVRDHVNNQILHVPVCIARPALAMGVGLSVDLAGKSKILVYNADINIINTDSVFIDMTGSSSLAGH